MAERGIYVQGSLVGAAFGYDDDFGWTFSTFASGSIGVSADVWYAYHASTKELSILGAEFSVPWIVTEPTQVYMKAGNKMKRGSNDMTFKEAFLVTWRERRREFLYVLSGFFAFILSLPYLEPNRYAFVFGFFTTLAVLVLVAQFFRCVFAKRNSNNSQ